MANAPHSAAFYNYTCAQDPFDWRRQPVGQFVDEHDLIGLGPWGPYGKRYFGLSYLPGPSGVRIDFVCAFELHRRSLSLPHAIQESGYLPWSCTSDFSRYTYRQQILAKDQLYADVTFERRKDGYAIHVRYHNQTDLTRDVRLHLCAALQPFADGAWQPKTIQAADAIVPEGCAIIDALDYAKSNFGMWPADGLNWDGARQSECLQDGFVNGRGISWPEGDDKAITFKLPAKAPSPIALRYVADREVTLTFDFGAEQQSVTLPASTEPTLSPIISIPADATQLTLHGKALLGLKLDCLVLGTATPEFQLRPSDVFAELTSQQHGDYTLRWPGLDGHMELTLGEETFNRRYVGDLDQALLLGMHNHVSEEFSAPGIGHFHDFVFPRVSVLANGQLQREYTVRWVQDDATNAPAPGHTEEAPAALSTLPNTDAVRFGVDRLAAVVQTNIVYPVRTRGRIIRHFPPGRWWDSLYNWDCGFVALGLAELSPRRAVELLNTYVTETDDAECAYIHHGSPVPVQHYLYHDLWQKTQDRTLLKFFYPRLARWLRYLAGHDERSPTRPFQTALLRTWDLFYNSGGWDDYPPQHSLTHNHELRARVAPMVVSSHVSTAADILAMAARELGEDPTEWETLAADLSRDIDAHAWDSEAGIYGYVEHDANGAPTGLYRHASGANYNFGLDGAMPAVTGRIDAARSEAIWQMLADEQRFFTELGLSTVDQTAPYYSPHGYWNGATWIPYQFAFWRAALDAGKADFARAIAQRVLTFYNRETADSYSCFEHFMNDSGRGAGWHHFGGLSSPVLNLFAAYGAPGRISTGFRAWIHQQAWQPGAQGVEFEVSTLGVAGGAAPVVVVTLDPQTPAQLTINGEPATAHSPYAGLYEITLPATPGKHRVILT